MNNQDKLVTKLVAATVASLGILLNTEGIEEFMKKETPALTQENK